jgi:DNA-binding transcriptional regulator YhcF (GntR family)
MLATPAWLSLPVIARAAYIHLAVRYDGSNNGKISLSTRVLAKELGCCTATAARALTSLDDAGFIRPTSIGQFKLKNRKASEYRLTAFRCDETGEAATRDFQQWVPPIRSDSLTQETVQYHQRVTPLRK